MSKRKNLACETRFRGCQSPKFNGESKTKAPNKNHQQWPTEPVLIGVKRRGLPEGTRFRGRQFSKTNGESKPNVSN